MKKFFLGAFLALSALLSFTACDDDDDAVTPQTISALAEKNADLTSLFAALKRAGLEETLKGAGPFTVFAPTNAAFTKFLADNKFANLEAVPVDLLKNVLLNHVVSGDFTSTTVPAGYVSSLSEVTLGGTKLPLSLLIQKTSGVKVSNATVTTPNVDASNGTVHVIDAVIGLPTVVTHALNNPAFTTLVAALTRSDLGVNYVQTLSGAGPFTVFAPTNDAFADLLKELNFTGLAAIPANVLNAVLQYHVVSGANARAGGLTNGQKIKTFQGADLTIEKSGTTVTILDARGRKAPVAIADVQGTNGVVHAIGKVILPPQ